MKVGRPSISSSGEEAKSVGIKLPPEVRARIEHACEIEGISISKWICCAIDAKLRQDDAPGR